MRLILIALAAVLLSGCAQLQIVRGYGANAADGVLEGGLYATCTAATVGSLVRRYGTDADGRAAWQMMCEHEWSRGAGAIHLPEIRR
jgi:hypothetical protein